MATWIEFLNYEYWKYDRSAGVVNRRQSRYDEAWKKLVDASVLKPFETEESLWAFGFGFQLKSEEIEAEKEPGSEEEAFD